MANRLFHTFISLFAACFVFTSMAQAGGTIDAGLRINIPCINVNGGFYETSLVPWFNTSDPGGYYWQLGGSVAPSSDDGDCASLGSTFAIFLPNLSVSGILFDVTLPFYASSENPNDPTWTLGNIVPVSTASPFSLTSQEFSNGSPIPLEYACTSLGGSNLSPHLSWSSPPSGTQSYALVMDDEDSPCGTGANACRHWAVFNIPASVTEFAKAQDMNAVPGATEGLNWEGMTGYTGPCPPNQHTYTFTVYALSAGMPVISQGTPMTRSQFESAYKAYIIESATLQGLFSP